MIQGIIQGIKQLWNVFVGAIIMCGYFLYESMIFGVALWIVWNGAIIPYLQLLWNKTHLISVQLPLMEYITAVGILFVVKILFFDATKIGNKIKP